jgi:hypothetical protein
LQIFWPSSGSKVRAISREVSNRHSRVGGRVRGVATDQDLSMPDGNRCHRTLDPRCSRRLDTTYHQTEFHQVAILKNSPDMKGGGCACIDSGTQT